MERKNKNNKKKIKTAVGEAWMGGIIWVLLWVVETQRDERPTGLIAGTKAGLALIEGPAIQQEKKSRLEAEEELVCSKVLGEN